MSKIEIRSSFMSPVTSGGKKEKEFRFERRERLNRQIASIDKKIRRALNRGDIDSVMLLTAQRNIFVSQI